MWNSFGFSRFFALGRVVRLLRSGRWTRRRVAFLAFGVFFAWIAFSSEVQAADLAWPQYKAEVQAKGVVVEVLPPSKGFYEWPYVEPEDARLALWQGFGSWSGFGSGSHRYFFDVIAWTPEEAAFQIAEQYAYAYAHDLFVRRGLPVNDILAQALNPSMANVPRDEHGPTRFSASIQYKRTPDSIWQYAGVGTIYRDALQVGCPEHLVENEDGTDCVDPEELCEEGEVLNEEGECETPPAVCPPGTVMGIANLIAAAAWGQLFRFDPEVPEKVGYEGCEYVFNQSVTDQLLAEDAANGIKAGCRLAFDTPTDEGLPTRTELWCLAGYISTGTQAPPDQVGGGKLWAEIEGQVRFIRRGSESLGPEEGGQGSVKRDYLEPGGECYEGWNCLLSAGAEEVTEVVKEIEVHEDESVTETITETVTQTYHETCYVVMNGRSVQMDCEEAESLTSVTETVNEYTPEGDLESSREQRWGDGDRMGEDPRTGRPCIDYYSPDCRRDEGGEGSEPFDPADPEIDYGGEDADGVPEFGQRTEEFWEHITGKGVIGALTGACAEGSTGQCNGWSFAIPEGGVPCPAFDFGDGSEPVQVGGSTHGITLDLFDSSGSEFQAHCQVADRVRPILSAAMLLFWGLVGFRIVASA